MLLSLPPCFPMFPCFLGPFATCLHIPALALSKLLCLCALLPFPLSLCLYKLVCHGFPCTASSGVSVLSAYQWPSAATTRDEVRTTRWWLLKDWDQTYRKTKGIIWAKQWTMVMFRQVFTFWFNFNLAYVPSTAPTWVQDMFLGQWWLCTGKFWILLKIGLFCSSPMTFI